MMGLNVENYDCSNCQIEFFVEERNYENIHEYVNLYSLFLLVTRINIEIIWKKSYLIF